MLRELDPMQMNIEPKIFVLKDRVMFSLQEFLAIECSKVLEDDGAPVNVVPDGAVAAEVESGEGHERKTATEEAGTEAGRGQEEV